MFVFCWKILISPKETFLIHRPGSGKIMAMRYAPIKNQSRWRWTKWEKEDKINLYLAPYAERLECLWAWFECLWAWFLRRASPELALSFQCHVGSVKPDPGRCLTRCNHVNAGLQPVETTGKGSINMRYRPLPVTLHLIKDALVIYICADIEDDSCALAPGGQQVATSNTIELCFISGNAELQDGENQSEAAIEQVEIKHPAAGSGVLTALLQSAGFQPAFAPRGGELNPQRLKITTWRAPSIVAAN